MPYVKPEERGNYVQLLKLPENPGQLNYLLTSIVNAYYKGRWADEELGYLGLSYSGINEIIGVLECMKQEWYRRVAAPYENEKERENGDLPWPTSLP